MSGAARGCTLAEIVARLGGDLRGDPALRVTQVATLESAGPEHVSFLANPKYRAQLAGSRAGAVILDAKSAAAHAGSCIVTERPYAYFARVSQLLNPVRRGPPGIHPSAVVDSALPASVSVGAGCVVAADVTIGENTTLGPGCIVGEGVRIGADCLFHARVTVYAGCVIGSRAIVHSGAVIGADGFGFAPDGQGGWIKIPQIGRVVIGDDVEIGANTAIDRGALDDTVIEDGVKLDNQIQIAHNVHVGRDTIIAACTGIAGSAQVGSRCQLGGAALIIGHSRIADGTVIAAASYIGKSIPKAGMYTGQVPSLPHEEWLKNYAHLRHLDALADRIRALEARAAQSEKKA